MHTKIERTVLTLTAINLAATLLIVAAYAGSAAAWLKRSRVNEAQARAVTLQATGGGCAAAKTVLDQEQDSTATGYQPLTVQSQPH